jgi:hypothetical protein
MVFNATSNIFQLYRGGQFAWGFKDSDYPFGIFKLCESEKETVKCIISYYWGSPPSGIGDLSRFWLFYVGHLVLLLNKNIDIKFSAHDAFLE